jgi:hypothetical protein
MRAFERRPIRRKDLDHVLATLRTVVNSGGDGLEPRCGRPCLAPNSRAGTPSPDLRMRT